MIKLVQLDKKMDGGVFITTKQDNSNITELRYESLLKSSAALKKLGSTYIKKVVGDKIIKEILISECKKFRTERRYTF